jgi:pentatricopeptide repeat protein
VYINKSLIHLYGTCGCLDLARKKFEIMPERNVVPRNAIVDSCVRLGEFDTALKLFGEILNMFEPDGHMMQSVISACVGLGYMSLGMWAHTCFLRKCRAEMVDDVLVNNCLVDMYCKCGSWQIAQQIVERMPKRDVNSRNSMILGLAMHGKAKAALEYFDRMVGMERFVPDFITFVGVLGACNHIGLLRKK